MTRHRLLARGWYQLRFRLAKLLWMPRAEGVSVLLVTWNRAAFLRECLRALSETLPEQHEVLVWDNASTDDTAAVLQAARESRLKMTVVHSRSNIGTAAYALLALRCRYRWIVEIDDDILALPKDWTAKMIAALRIFKGLAYLSLDVVQDDYTGGGKPQPERYSEQSREGIAIEFGPAGGWAAMVPRAFYFQSGGFPYRPHKPFFSEDGYYNQRVQQLGRRSGILKGVCAYHATGPAWNAALGYGTLFHSKQAMLGAAATPEYSGKLPDLSVLDVYRRHAARAGN